ncbi:hypothetical protein A6E13_01845 [Aliivibrio fischeri]|uniref:protelomerase family protein n=1 Tax=Aliivibrio fischeri TaxID=668 RepID=UPI00080DB732|nr:protelomerase family protein [Aliivibrio fischeri]OCH31298.1 hypothetical protein A6E13_01845 [Aliivibrio fischeri]
MTTNTINPDTYKDSDNIERRKRKFNYSDLVMKFLKEVRDIDLQDIPQGQKSSKHKRAADKVLNALFGKRAQKGRNSLSFSTASAYLTDIRNEVTASGVKHHAFEQSLARIENNHPMCAYMLNDLKGLKVKETRLKWRDVAEKLKLAKALEKMLKGITPDNPRYSSIINSRIKELPEWANELNALKTLKRENRAEALENLHKIIDAAPEFYIALTELKIDHEVMRHLKKDAFSRDSSATEKKTALNSKKEATVNIDYPKVMQLLDFLLGKSSRHSWEAIAVGVALSTGRRAIEVLWQGEFEKIDKHTLKFVGQAKLREGRTLDEMIIYTLADADVILEAIDDLRSFPNILSLETLEATRNYSINKLVSNRTAGPLNVFMRSITESIPITVENEDRNWLFKDTRAIYAKICFELFFKNDKRWQKKDENIFYKELLGHHDTDTQIHYMQFKIMNAGAKWEPIEANSDKRRLDAVKAMTENEWVSGTKARRELHQFVIEQLEKDPYQTFKPIDLRKGRNYAMVKEYLSVMEDALKLDWSIDAILEHKAETVKTNTSKPKQKVDSEKEAGIKENKVVPKEKEVVATPKVHFKSAKQNEDDTWSVVFVIDGDVHVEEVEDAEHIRDAGEQAWAAWEFGRSLPETMPKVLVAKQTGGMWHARIMINGHAAFEAITPSKASAKQSVITQYNQAKR